MSIHKYNNAFTLIEILIVVAIIGILTAIAVPKFSEVQMRAKVSHSLMEMRTLGEAIEMLRADKGVLLIDCVDSTVYSKQSRQRIEEVFSGVGFDMSIPRPAVDILAPLTSPVSYLNSLPQDPFSPLIWDDFPDWRVTTVYKYIDNDPKIPGYDYWELWWPYPLSEGNYFLMGFGPVGVKTYIHNKVIVPYDPTNGAISMGDIIWIRSGEKINVNVRAAQ